MDKTELIELLKEIAAHDVTEGSDINDHFSEVVK